MKRPGKSNQRKVVKAVTKHAGSGGVPPYGPPILEAMARGNLQEMKAVAAAAREALYGVRFKRVTPKNAQEVSDALNELEAAIAKLEGKAS